MQKLTASDRRPEDFLGFSVALSDDTAVLGAKGESSGATFNQGAAYVFDLLLTKPTPTPTLPPGVGGIALDNDVALRPLEAPASPSSSIGERVWAIAAVVGAAALGSAAWYARRRVAS